MLEVAAFGEAQSVLFLGAHPDDVEIGCGGTISYLRRTHPGLSYSVVIVTGTPERAAEAAAAAGRFCGDDVDISVLGHRDGYVPFDGAAVKDAVREATAHLDPDVVFTHRRDDLHQDHAFVAALAGQLFRSQIILEYEIPKYDGDLGGANTYVHLSPEDAAAKLEGILESYPSQRSKYWMTPELLMAPLRLRGVESRAPDLLAEAFVVRKAVYR
jgi:LmbE family N-acetylglucosaminyl deacetylase